MNNSSFKFGDLYFEQDGVFKKIDGRLEQIEIKENPLGYCPLKSEARAITMTTNVNDEQMKNYIDVYSEYLKQRN